MKIPLRIVAPIFACAIASTAAAHEFWISPTTYQIASGGTISANIRVGQNFEGSAYSFIPQNFARFEYVSASGSLPVEGRLGDRPAAAIQTQGAGLHVLIHESTDTQLTYTEFATFETFIRHKDELWVLDDHLERGLPSDGFSESFRRFAKSLVSVGNGAGEDARVGLDWELVAMTNPYTDDLSSGFTVQLWKGDAPVADAQIELFEKAPDGTVNISLYKTDPNGVSTFPVTAGHEYLVDSVELVALDPDDPATQPVWHSNWASLTFMTPLG